MKLTSFTQLQAWQTGMELVKEIYSTSKNFPDDERFGITSQIRRASVSIIANIAEGFGRRTSPDKASKYVIARGECSECHALILVCCELRYISDSQAQQLIHLTENTGKLLTGLIKSHNP